MGMDPSDEAIKPFYQRMAELGVVLLTHAGEEAAVEAEKAQELGMQHTWKSISCKKDRRSFVD